VQSDEDLLIAAVAAIAAQVTGARSVRPDARLELNPLAQAEFALALEDVFGVRIDDGSRLSAVSDAADAVLQGKPRPAQSLHSATGRIQSTVRSIVAPPFRWYFDLVVSGEDQVPRAGPVVLAANHDSMWDVPLLVAAAERPIVFMAVAGVFESRAASWVFTRLGGFPIRRGVGDLAGLRAAIDVLRSDRMLGIYPEGTRRPGRLLPFRPGAAWLALVTGATLLPVGIVGTREIVRKGSWVPRRAPVRISFGHPLDVVGEKDPRARLDQAPELTERLRSEVERLIRR
jgi:1-acyl-sn-glycerol-3-phosphate acyltransferase